MNRISLVLLPLLVLSMSAALYGQLVVPGIDNTPGVGTKPPDFELPKGLNPKDTLGMKDFAGKKRVLITFYPADFTAG